MVKSVLLLQMMDLLRESPGLDIAQLGARLGRSQRTVYRYLESLSDELHVGVYCDDGGYYIAERPVGSRLDLSPKEVLAVRLALTVGAIQKQGPFAEHARGAWQKIESALTSDTIESVRSAIRRHSIAVPNMAKEDGESGVAKAIADAVENNQQVNIVYRSLRSGETRDLIIDPYALVFRRHNWYIIAHSKSHNRIIQLKLIRVVAAELSGETFQLPHDFSVDSFYAKSWEMWSGGDVSAVRIKFSPQVAPLIRESKRHPSQKIEDLPDGSIIFSVTVSGLEEVGFWILSYGADAEVLEPAKLRSFVRDTAKTMLQTYGGGNGSTASELQSMEVEL
jgi:predicted DNA-binding transcriptional regulator YafY